MAKKTIFYSDLMNDDFATNNISAIKVDENFKFANRNIFWRIGSFLLYYIIAVPIVFAISKLYLGLKFNNREVFKKLHGKSCFLYGNHTRDLDAFLPAMASFPKRAYIVANPDAVSIKGLRHIVMMLGCIPIPTEFRAMPMFLLQ